MAGHEAHRPDPAGMRKDREAGTDWPGANSVPRGRSEAWAALSGLAALVISSFFPGVKDDPFFGVVAFSVWGFTIGVAISASLALGARGRSSTSSPSPGSDSSALLAACSCRWQA